MSRSVLNNLIYSYKSPPVENFVFQLVTRWTVYILLTFSLILTCKLVLGDSFACVTTYDAVPQTYLNTKCYADYVYIFTNQLSQDEFRFPSSRLVRNDDYKKYIYYYPWVNLAFLLHAFVFHKPHLFWKVYECGYVGRLTAGLQVALSKEQKRSMEIHCLAKYLLQTQGKHLLYVSLYVFFEVCNFFISISQIVWLMNFFDVSGSSTGLAIDLSDGSNYRDFYFPPRGSCSVTKYTASGERLTLEATCILPLNDIYMKMFFFLRWWYIFLTLATAMVIVYRVALLLPWFRTLVLRVTTPLAPRSTVQEVCHQISYSDWVFLRAVQKSVVDVDFAKVLNKFLVITQNKGKDPLPHDDEDEKSSIYEDSR